jgi:hypothetical protein
MKAGWGTWWRRRKGGNSVGQMNPKWGMPRHRNRVNFRGMGIKLVDRDGGDDVGQMNLE